MSASLITLGFYQRRPAGGVDGCAGGSAHRGGGWRVPGAGGGDGHGRAGWWRAFGLHAMGGFDAQMTAQVQKAIQQSSTPVPAENDGTSGVAGVSRRDDSDGLCISCGGAGGLSTLGGICRAAGGNCGCGAGRWRKGFRFLEKIVLPQGSHNPRQPVQQFWNRKWCLLVLPAVIVSTHVSGCAGETTSSKIPPRDAVLVADRMVSFLLNPAFWDGLYGQTVCQLKAARRVQAAQWGRSVCSGTAIRQHRVLLLCPACARVYELYLDRGASFRCETGA